MAARAEKRGKKPLFKVPPPPQTSSTFNTTNGFATLNPDVNLSDDEMESISSSLLSFTSARSKRRKLGLKNAAASKVTTEKKIVTPKPPPIFIQGLSAPNANLFLADIKTSDDDFQLRFVPNGVQVFPANIEAHKALKTKLKSNGNKFFTHQLREEQTTKIVLHGLYAMPTEELMELLNDAGIKPSDIKIMNIHQKRYADHCVYLLYFMKIDKIKISTLREISAINHVRVRWEYYSNKRQGPIQCSRCMQYGHGVSSCFLDPVCIRCGSNHSSKECPLLKDPVTNQIRTRIPDELLKCGLCGNNHSANFNQCVKRVEFIERQQVYRARIQRRPRVNQQPIQQHLLQRRFTAAQQLENFNFPGINEANAQNGIAWTNGNSRNVQNPINQTQIPNGCFNPSELLTIFKELMTTLKQATTPEQQIYALGEIVIKYCNGRTP